MASFDNFSSTMPMCTKVGFQSRTQRGRMLQEKAAIFCSNRRWGFWPRPIAVTHYLHSNSDRITRPQIRMAFRLWPCLAKPFQDGLSGYCSVASWVRSHAPSSARIGRLTTSPAGTGRAQNSAPSTINRRRLSNRSPR